MLYTSRVNEAAWQNIIEKPQGDHSPRLCFAVWSQWLLLLFIFNSLANLLACFVQIFMDSGKVLHFRFSILSLFLPILVNHYLELYFKTDSGYSFWPIRRLVWFEIEAMETVFRGDTQALHKELTG